jgi:hypothetical protein
MNRKEKACDVLEKAIETRDDRLMWLKISSYLDSFTDDARFQQLLRKMNLE